MGASHPLSCQEKPERVRRRRSVDRGQRCLISPLHQPCTNFCILVFSPPFQEHVFDFQVHGHKPSRGGQYTQQRPFRFKNLFSETINSVVQNSCRFPRGRCIISLCSSAVADRSVVCDKLGTNMGGPSAQEGALEGLSRKELSFMSNIQVN